VDKVVDLAFDFGWVDWREECVEAADVHKILVGFYCDEYIVEWIEKRLVLHCYCLVNRRESERWALMLEAVLVKY
jgi:hypothetical protein